MSRATGKADLGSQLVDQLFATKRVLYIVAGILFGFGVLQACLDDLWDVALIMILAGRAMNDDGELSTNSDNGGAKRVMFTECRRWR